MPIQATLHALWSVRLELVENPRDLALFNRAIDSKLRGCDLVKMKVVDVMASGQIKERASVLRSKTQKPIRFETSEGARVSVEKWMEEELMVGSEHRWPGRFHARLHISTRQYARNEGERTASSAGSYDASGVTIKTQRKRQIKAPSLRNPIALASHNDV